MSFKKKSKADIDALVGKLEAMNRKGGGKYEDDGTEWKPTKDAAGNGLAVIRLLPAKDDGVEDVPFVKIYSHSVKHNGQWYIENCPTTIGQECPVCDANKELWNSGIESNKKLASDRKRKLRYTGNIVVLQDKANAETEGKVFKFGFGVKIMEKIIAMGKPEFPGQPCIDVTDVFEGAPMYLKLQKVNGQNNYDASAFGPSAPLFDGDEKKLEAAYAAMHPLTPLVAADQFKPYDQLLAKWNKIMGKTEKVIQKAKHEDLADLSQVDETDDIPFDLDTPDHIAATGDDDLDDFFNNLDS